MKRLAIVAGALLLAGPARVAPPDDDARLPARPLAMTGVNLAGAEFGGDRRPLVAGRDYVYPDRAVAAPFLAAGMNTVRLPVRWENLQRAPLAPLDPAETARLDAALAALAPFRWIVLDIHNGARFQGVTLADDARSAAQLADLWRRLARRYAANPRVVFGLMNEPVGLPAAAWRRIAEASVTAIRATGARNLILVPGVDFSGAHSWTSGANAATLAGFRDPANNMAFELHQYLDDDSSGTHPGCVDRREAVARMRAETAWLEAHHARGFLGEVGTGPGAGCADALDALLGHLDRHASAWLGWTAWAGGGWWGDNPFSLQPDHGREKPQMAVLRRHILPAHPGDRLRDTPRAPTGQ